MGLRELCLVTPRHFPDAEASARAVGAADLLDRARVCATLDEALAGCRFVVGMTARRRDLSHDMLSLRASALRAAEELATPVSDGCAAAAFVFGTEMSGLSNAELERCTVLANIPTDPDFGSLNLGAAVQLVCYELRQAVLGDQPLQPYPQPLARHEDIEALFQHLEQTLHLTGFLRPARPKRLMERLRRLLMRSRMEHEEVSLLRGLLRSFEVSASGKGPPEYLPRAERAARARAARLSAESSAAPPPVQTPSDLALPARLLAEPAGAGAANPLAGPADRADNAD
jgi:tRNA/rRNA methyltransferase